MQYSTVIYVHTLIAFSALGTYWIAALSKKGSKLHRTAGKIYCLCIIVILLSVFPMIFLKLKEGDYPRVVLLGYLFSIVFTATWVTWQSIHNKKSLARYQSFFFKLIATALTLYGVSILVMGIIFGSFLQLVFSSVGITLGLSMWWNVWQNPSGQKWFLSQHMNGVAVNFAATHGSFFRFGLASFLPIPDSPDLNTFAQTSMIVLALILRLWVGGMYLKKARKAEGKKAFVMTKSKA